MWTVDRLGQWRNQQYGGFEGTTMAWSQSAAKAPGTQVAPNRRATEGPTQLRPSTATTVVNKPSTGYGSSRQRSTSLGTESGQPGQIQRKPLCPLNTTVVPAAVAAKEKDFAAPVKPVVVKAVVPPPSIAAVAATPTVTAVPIVQQPQPQVQPQQQPPQPQPQQQPQQVQPQTQPKPAVIVPVQAAPATTPVASVTAVPAAPLPTNIPTPKMPTATVVVPASTRRASISSAPTPPALPKTLTRARPSPNPPATYNPSTMKQWGALNRAIYRKKCGAAAAAVAHITGMRESNEDTHVVEHHREGGVWHSVFGVFDGHGGAQCSKFLAEAVPAAVKRATPPLTDAALTDLALELDHEYVSKHATGGSTAAFAIVTSVPGSYYDVQLCHVGNARAILVRRGKILHETRDHTPLVPEERERIERAGGTVVDARLDGRLENSRAFGDAAWKIDASGQRPEGDAVRTARLIAVPTVTRLLCEEGDVLIIACDGLFETADTDTACQRIYQGLLQNKELGTLAAECCEQAVWSGSEDNVTVMLVQFGPANLGIAEREFVPGPYHPRTKDFCAAYREDVLAAGWTLGKAMAKRCQFLRRMEQQSTEKGQPLAHVLQFELRSWLCGGPNLPLDSQEAWSWFEQLAAHWEKQLDASANRH